MSSISNTDTAYVEGACRHCEHHIIALVSAANPDGARVRCKNCRKTTFFPDYKPRYQIEGPDGDGL